MLTTYRKLRVGDPAAKETTTGALISKEHLKKVQNYVELAVGSENGKVECGYTRDELHLCDKLQNVSTHHYPSEWVFQLFDCVNYLVEMEYGTSN